jgi:radical SAM protein with 4Fe4S-binding SPASM domain
VAKKDPSKLLNDVFCMAPWSHLHVTPAGNVYPCCLINENTSLLGNVNNTPLKEIWNSPEIKDIRLSMLANKQHKSCEWCYVKERDFGSSFRFDFNEKYGDDLSLVNSTKEDGTVEKMQMRYIDIRFSNLCNLKCRMCGPTFSSQIAAENGIKPAIKSIPNHMLDEVYGYLETCEEMYFAGGEPLMMDEHYLILEKLIELGVKPRIRYNSNITKLKHKHWDILELWSHFDDIYIQASIDGFGPELTYIRHPAKYDSIIETALKYLTVPSVRIDISTCVGFWNIWSLPELHIDLYEKGVIEHYNKFRMQAMIHPRWFTPKVLPAHIKEQVTEKINNHLTGFISQQEEIWKQNGKCDKAYRDYWTGVVNYMNAEDHYEHWVKYGIDEIKKKDEIRSENFSKTFPLLKEMLDV